MRLSRRAASDHGSAESLSFDAKHVNVLYPALLLHADLTAVRYFVASYLYEAMDTSVMKFISAAI